MAAPPLRLRILMPPESWTPVLQEVFSDVLPELEHKRAAVLYFVLYDRVRHSESRAVRASIAQLSRWSGLNERTVVKCMAELREKKFVRRKKHGTKHSRTDKPLWRVPLANFEAGLTSWVPVPRFIFQRYIRQYFGCVLLPVLLRYQHIHWRNDCWVGVTTLTKTLNWSPTAVRKVLQTMFLDKLWNPRSSDLPRPLEMRWHPNKEGQERRRFRALAVWYERKGAKGRRYSTVKISNSFAEYFRIPLKPTTNVSCKIG